MILDSLAIFFQRDLEKLKSEIDEYRNEENIWRINGNITNSAGNLCLHLVGNLNAFIGAQLGNTGYIRQRDLEFSMKNIPKSELISQIDQTKHMVDDVLKQLSEAQLQEDFPIQVFQNKTSTEYMLVHLSTHLAYHLGQVNYHRRLLDK
jgi:uncharacterized damage-inducible protein DinB